jgi:4-alpha-glucanotransferase
MKSVVDRRRSGVLLHPTSLPGGPIGTLGDEAFRFVDWLKAAGQGLWQMLPLVAVSGGGSPYNGLSAMAGNTLLLDAGRLAADGLVDAEDEVPAHTQRVDFAAAAARSEDLVGRAHEGFRAGRTPALRGEFEEYRGKHAYWLEDYALFRALRDAHGSPWTLWEPGLRSRRPAALKKARARHEDAIERHAFGQFLFDRQWGGLRRYANDAGVAIVGDIPIFVSHDSADVWAHPRLFSLDADGEPTVVSGVPPDYFSETGQRWGNPLYRWHVMARNRFRWWTERFRRTLEWVDLARVDHFRGFEAYWEVPGHEETALNGQWKPGPGSRLFAAVAKELGPLPLIAEDLGLITPEVDALRESLGLPGMRVLQFAFGDDERNPHLPANYEENTVAYTGTHDNDTAMGWYRCATEADRADLRKLTGAPDRSVNWGMMEVVFQSPAALAVVPLQDVLGLGSEDRMNIPGTIEGNWGWRFRAGDLTPALSERLNKLTHATGRLHGEEST